MSEPTVSLTVVQSIKPDILSKSFFLGEDGSLIKQSGGNMIEGTCWTWCPTVTEFATGLAALQPNQALVFGVCGHDTATILPKAVIQKGNHSVSGPVVARDRDHFRWPEGPGVLMIDYDPEKDKPPLPMEELLDAFYVTWPDLRKHPHVWCASASSSIYRVDTGEELRGVLGQRIYVFVQDATDIPRAGTVLFKRLWLSGFGRYDLSKSGSLLERSLADASVWQPERFDFAGGAQCGQGLEQRRPVPVVLGF